MRSTKRAAAKPAYPDPVDDFPREFVFSDADFRSLAKLAYEHAGIALADSKKNLVYSRLSRRLRVLGLSSFGEYREYLAENAAELESFTNSISTNLTKFFREAHHFEHLRKEVAVSFVQSAQRRSGQRLRIWSAGCSTGEEPYTIAVVLKREIHNIGRHDVRILATDIDTDVLTKAATGEYSASSIDSIPGAYREFFEKSVNVRGEAKIVAGDDIRSLITFRRLNLMEAWPFKGQFDAIFCRNVMIYFDTETKLTLIERFTKQIRPGGCLYIGHSESLLGEHPGLEHIGHTIYRRTL